MEEKQEQEKQEQEKPIKTNKKPIKTNKNPIKYLFKQIINILIIDQPLHHLLLHQVEQIEYLAIQ